MRTQPTLSVLLFIGSLSGACSDENDDPFMGTNMDPSSVPDAGPNPGATPATDASAATLDAMAPLIDAALDGAPPQPVDPAADASVAERPHDERTFSFDPAMQTPLEALPGVETQRWSGVLDGAGYLIEVPTNWNGTLVMYAHGYGGEGDKLNVRAPSIRRHLIEKGYAWAASSYSANYYDVRAGVEDTNALALAFTRIAAENGVSLEEPSKRYIIGHSMGGHISGAAVERETLATARNKVKYQAALPMCGVMGDTELFDYFAAYQVAAHHLAGIPVSEAPFPDYAVTRMQVQDALFTTFPTMTTPTGAPIKPIVMNLTGGARPVFDEGFANARLQAVVWDTFGGDGTINGILAKPVTDTRDIFYQLDADPAVSEAEQAFNAAIYRSVPAEDANARRSDGLRFIPVINGEFDVPVLSLHTLGDMYVPFSMQQIYRKRAEAKGSGERLVQRAIRGIGHCEFTYAEQTQAFDALAAWEETGMKPAGDDVLDPATVSSPSYGCDFTAMPTSDDSPGLAALRAQVACTTPAP